MRMKDHIISYEQRSEENVSQELRVVEEFPNWKWTDIIIYDIAI